MEKHPEKKEPETEDPTGDRCKKPYRTPQLTVHGTVTELTTAGVNASVDGPVGSTIA